MRGVVAGTIGLTTWDLRYLDFLWKWVNVPSLDDIDTARAATHPPIFLNIMADSDAGATTMCEHSYFYFPYAFVLILLAGKLSLVKDCHMLWAALITSNLEADCQAVVYWMLLFLVRYSTGALPPPAYV